GSSQINQTDGNFTEGGGGGGERASLSSSLRDFIPLAGKEAEELALEDWYKRLAFLTNRLGKALLPGKRDLRQAKNQSKIFSQIGGRMAFCLVDGIVAAAVRMLSVFADLRRTHLFGADSEPEKTAAWEDKSFAKMMGNPAHWIHLENLLKRAYPSDASIPWQTVQIIAQKA